MNTITIKTQHIVGISVRTTNENGQAAKDIEALWQQFRNEDIQHQIPNKISDDIYAVYTDYESDFTRPYTTLIGLPVSTLDNIPEGMTGITIETDVYQQFTSKGKMPEAVVNTWLEIWGDKAFNQKRAYHADFTVHGKKYHDGDQAEVETFISLKRT
ncbi:GyrI-like domain-containing protein [Empedobacter brevis]|uniref:GyrI-like domain-containing protein n=1 Tax=Empedobacter brevis TaxID=247 RepID=UPI0023F0380F|nr:effector binding domain-containing protein [Empedobacter brevis]